MTVTAEIQKLEGMFDRINERFYQNKLKRPVIQFYQDRTKSAYGWITTSKAWNLNGQEEYELNICANTVTDHEKIVATLMHEMVHLYSMENGVKDVSNNGFYHNKKFKQIAEAHGLVISHDGRYGWTITRLNEEGKELAKTLEPINMRYGYPQAESTIEEEEPKKKEKRSWVYRCPICGEEIRSRNQDGAYYDECGEKFVRVD